MVSVIYEVRKILTVKIGFTVVSVDSESFLGGIIRGMVIYYRVFLEMPKFNGISGQGFCINLNKLSGSRSL